MDSLAKKRFKCLKRIKHEACFVKLTFLTILNDSVKKKISILSIFYFNSVKPILQTVPNHIPFSNRKQNGKFSYQNYRKLLVQRLKTNM